MKRIVNIFTAITVLIQFLAPAVTFAKVPSVDINKSGKVEEITQMIKQGKKVSLEESFSFSEGGSSRYVVFVKKGAYEKGKKAVALEGGVFSFSDKHTYGEVKAIPVDLSYMSKKEINEFLKDVHRSADVVAITPVEKRELTQFGFNDPLFPNMNEYTDDKQWYLSQPNSGYYGIDVKRAWEYIFYDLEKPYGGSTDVVVAVIDTGGAYESNTKYNLFGKMVDPLPWTFSKSPDYTTNLFVNSDETANNQTDDDANSVSDYCLDINADGECDAGEQPSFIDDYNGADIVDWGRYWSRASLSDVLSATVCTNEPYLTNGVKCVQNPSYDSVCATNSLENYEYLGCYSSEMGHPNDARGHGTFISNIISAVHNNSTSGTGIAPGISLMNVKIFGEYYDATHSAWTYMSVYGDQIANAINYATDNGADILNLSFAGNAPDAYEKLAIDEAYYDNDVLVVAASGNASSSLPWYPAAYASVLSVGASSKTGLRVSYSNYGSTLEMVAPVGGGIPTEGFWDSTNSKDLVKTCSWNPTEYCIDGNPEATPSIFANFANILGSGTSFAAPQVVGVAALLKSVHNLSAQEMRYVLKASALPYGSKQFSTSIGYGILNAYNAIRLKDYRGVDIDGIYRIFQTELNGGYLYIRFSDDGGVTWSAWIKAGTIGVTGSGRITTISGTPGRVIGVARGSDYGVYSRYADNYGYSNQTDIEWSDWVRVGYTRGQITTIEASTNIVQAWKGTDNKIYSRYSSDAGENWTTSATPTNTFNGSYVAMVYQQASNKVLQVARGSNNYIMTRTSADLGQTWTAWNWSYDESYNDPEIVVSGSNIVRYSLNKYGVAVFRYSPDGGVNWLGRHRDWGTKSGVKGAVTFTNSPSAGTLVVSYRGIDNKVYTKYSENNGQTWVTAFIGTSLPSTIYCTTSVSMADAGGYVNQFIRGSNEYLYYRTSTNGGKTWGSWRNVGSIKTSGQMSSFYFEPLNRLFITVRGTNGYTFTRFSEDKGINYVTWISAGNTSGAFKEYNVQMDEIAPYSPPS